MFALRSHPKARTLCMKRIYHFYLKLKEEVLLEKNTYALRINRLSAGCASSVSHDGFMTMD